MLHNLQVCTNNLNELNYFIEICKIRLNFAEVERPQVFFTGNSLLFQYLKYSHTWETLYNADRYTTNFITWKLFQHNGFNLLSGLTRFLLLLYKPCYPLSKAVSIVISSIQFLYSNIATPLMFADAINTLSTSTFKSVGVYISWLKI